MTYRVDDGALSRQGYAPWGTVRRRTVELPTDYTFTGQREAGWGLHHFKARWYDSRLGRFAQADTVIPGAGNPLAWDRYAGLGNNPLRYTDPSGHNPECGPDGILCNTLGQVAFILDALVDYGVFDPLPNPSVISDPRYNTPGRVEAVIRNYDRFRRSLFARYGFGAIGNYLKLNGQLSDQIFMALIAYGEFASESGEVYLECIEAMSNQYYGEKTNNPGPMECRGDCTLQAQLQWATQMQAWYSSDFEDKFISTHGWIGQLNAAQMAIARYFHDEDSSWFLGNAAEIDLAKYDIVVMNYSNPPVYPGKPYFIVYQLRRP